MLAAHQRMSCFPSSLLLRNLANCVLMGWQLLTWASQLCAHRCSAVRPRQHHPSHALPAHTGLPVLRPLPRRNKDERQLQHMNVMKAGAITSHRIVAVSNK